MLSIDYRYEDGYFLVSPSCVKIPIHIPAVKQGLILQYEAGKRFYLKALDIKKTLVEIVFS
jgi:hypothetical protein